MPDTPGCRPCVAGLTFIEDYDRACNGCGGASAVSIDF
jgi:hypothetical protein